MTIFKRRALFMLAFLLPACGEHLVEFGGPPLGAAGTFAVLASSTVTNTGNTEITGDLGLSPGTSVAGFPPGTITGTMHVTDQKAKDAQADLIIAYDYTAGLTDGAVSVAGSLGGQTLTPGLYKSTSSLNIATNTALTLDAEGDSSAIFIFQIASALTTFDNSQIILSGDARAENVFWQVGSSATLGVDTVFKGTIMALGSISLADRAALDGRALARNGQVTMIDNTIVRP